MGSHPEAQFIEQEPMMPDVDSQERILVGMSENEFAEWLSFSLQTKVIARITNITESEVHSADDALQQKIDNEFLNNGFSSRYRELVNNPDIQQQVRRMIDDGANEQDIVTFFVGLLEHSS